MRSPVGACDAHLHVHVHVFGPLSWFPLSPTQTWTPVDAPKATLFARHKAMGIERCVIVQRLMHGFDHATVEDAVAAGGGLSWHALRVNATTERFASEDAVIGGGPSVEFAAFIAHEQRVWNEVVARANIRADSVCKYRYGRQSCASQSA